MTFDEYQKIAITTDLAGGQPKPVTDLAFIDKLLGLVGESGEVADKFKKIYRDRNGEFTDDDRQNIKKELGDVLWYINALCCYLDISLDDLAQANLDKLLDRKARNVLGGSGDNR